MKNFSLRISNFFLFKERSTTFKKEIIGGVSTFLAMAYILAVNPSMLSYAGNKGNNGYEGVFFLATALSAFLGTLAMGLFANVPIAVAPGMGVNAFFTYTVAGPILGLTLAQALIATFVSGILYAIIAISRLRILIVKFLPKNIKLAIGAMIGLFLAYIGLVNSGIIVSGAFKLGFAPNVAFGTPTKFGNLKDPFVIVAITILILIFVLHYAKIKGAAIIAIIIGVVLLAILKAAGVADAKEAFKLRSYNEFSKFPELSKSMWNAFGSSFTNGKFYIALFVFLYIDFFDTTGTLFSVGEQAKLNKNKAQQEKWLQKANLVDAGSTIVGSMLLTSTTTSYVESSVGVSQGARTGFSSLVIALLFLLGIAAWPIMSPILPIKHAQEGLGAYNDPFAPTVMPVTGPILVLVGSLMISQLKSFDFKETIDIPVLFVTLVIGLLSYSISTGIAAGLAIYFLINVSLYGIVLIKRKRGKDYGKYDEQHYKEKIFNPLMIALFVLALIYFGTMPLYAY